MIMDLTKRQKKEIKKKIKVSSAQEVASELNIEQKKIENYLKKIWRKEKYQKFVNQKKETQPNHISFKKYLTQNWRILAFLAFLVFAVYFNSLGNDFVSDDISAIRDNPNLNKISYFWQPPYFNINLRATIIFLTHKIFGLNPVFYRLANILFHLGSVWVIYFLTALFFSSTVPLFTASIFAVHPVLIETVTWISGGSYSYPAFFVLLSFLTYIWAVNDKKLRLYLVSVFSFYLSLLCSEKMIIFPVVLFLYEFCFGRLRTNWQKSIPFWGISGLWTVNLIGLFGARVTALETVHYQQSGLNNPLVQIPFAITSYLELIFWPKNLAFYHSEVVMPLPEYIIRVIVFAIFLVFVFWLYKKQRQLFFWAIFFFICLLPTLTPLRIAWVVAERYVYPAALGIYVIIGYCLSQLSKRFKNQKISWVVFGLILIALSARTIIRNRDWKNQDTLWLATAKTSPSSAQNHNNLGDLYSRRGEFEKAIEEFKIAIQLNPNYGDAYHNLANTYHQIQKDDLAVENYQKALSFNSNLWQSHQNLAAIFFDQEQYQVAQQHLEKATKINPQEAELYTNLGIIYFKLGEKEKAKQAFQQAFQLNPQDQKAKQALMELK